MVAKKISVATAEMISGTMSGRLITAYAAVCPRNGPARAIARAAAVAATVAMLAAITATVSEFSVAC